MIAASRTRPATDETVTASRKSDARRFTHDTPATPATAPDTNQNNRLNTGLTVVPEIPVTNGTERCRIG